MHYQEIVRFHETVDNGIRWEAFAVGAMPRGTNTSLQISLQKVFILLFSCRHASLQMALSVCLSVGLLVMLELKTLYKEVIPNQLFLHAFEAYLSTVLDPDFSFHVQFQAYSWRFAPNGLYIGLW